MLPIKRILVAWAATALFAWPAWAVEAEQASEESQSPSQPARTIYYKSAVGKARDGQSSRKLYESGRCGEVAGGEVAGGEVASDEVAGDEACDTVDNDRDHGNRDQDDDADDRVRVASFKSRTVQYSSNGRKVPVWRDVAQREVDPGDPFEAPDLGDAPEQMPAEPIAPGYSSSQWLQGGDACESCGQCGPCSCMGRCGVPSYVFGEYLYLQPIGVDMAHALQQNGAGGQGAVPDGSVGVVAPGFKPAYRAGFGVALGGCATIGAAYTNFQSHATDFLSAPAGVGGTVASLVLHPNTDTAGSTSSQVWAQYDIDFQLADIEYRRLIAGGCGWGSLNLTAGARYGQLNQRFAQLGSFATPTGEVLTSTNIEFDGVGFRTGLDGQRRLGASRISGYGKGFISVLFGDFRSEYTQFNTTTTIVEATSSWTDNRAVPLLEYEVGLSFTSHNGIWRMSTGYYAAYWFNAVTTAELVRAVQTSDFINLGQTVAFNGLVSRLEFRF